MFTQIIAEYCVDLDFDELPEEVIKKAKTNILDSVGCTIGGYKTDIGRIITKVIKRLGGKPESTLMGSGVRVAFVNSLLNNALDYDDCFKGHAGSTIVPPSIAVGEPIGASGRDLITAVVVAYEIIGRIATAMEPSKEHTSKVLGLGTYQTFGSVIAASKLLSLTKDQVISALGIAGANAPVPSVRKTSLNLLGAGMVKNNYGTASEVGVMAALMAKEGFSGPRDILDGDTGFWRWYSDRCDFKKMTKGLGKEYQILETRYKAYSTCWFHHPPIDAALHILRENKIDLDKIEKIKIGTFSQALEPPHDVIEVKSMVDVQQSLKCSLALALSGLKPGLDWFADDAFKNPKITEIAKKIEFVVDTEAEESYPPNMMAYVEMSVEGETYYTRVNYLKGEPTTPMIRDELREKFMRLTSYLETSKVKRIMNMINNFEKIKDIRDLTPLLCARPARAKNS
jgi:2-methylcitrate dehydratase PrpD